MSLFFDAKHEKLTYRPDIDGLRAIAIMAVVFFHLFPQTIAGGFIGVDVFFVISGFLITSILANKLDTNTFTFADFYARRVKRLFPALLVVLIACLIIGWFILFPSEYNQLGKHTVFSSGFLANWVFFQEGGYFDTPASQKPLLHLWSLGIEEQFYLLWPVILYWGRQRKNILIFLFLLSFCLNIFLVQVKPAFTFYMLPTRFWELMVGGALAYLPLKKLLPSFLKPTLSIIGMGVILIATFCFNSQMPFPGWAGLIPTLGAALIIMAGKDTWLNKRILSFKPLVFVGLISYPLYLWHWPLISFATIVAAGTPSLEIRFLILGVSGVLSIFTYYFIEKPIRHKPAKISLFLVGAMVLMAIIGKCVAKEKILPRLNYYGETKKIAEALKEEKALKNFENFDFQGYKLLRYGKGTKKVLFLGDSNIEPYAARMKHLINTNATNKQAIFATRGGCFPIPNVYGPHPKPFEKCMGFVHKVTQFAQDPQIESIVIAAHWIAYTDSYYYEKDNQKYFLKKNAEGLQYAYESLKKMIQEMIKNGKKVYLVLTIPSGAGFDPRSMIKRTCQGKFEVKTARVSKKELRPHEEKAVVLKKIAQETGAVIIDPMEVLCDESTCATLTSRGDPLYQDACHLRPWYVKNHIKFLDSIML